MKTKIHGLNIDFDDEYIFIENSYQINNVEKMQEIIMKVISKMDYPNIKRSLKSMIKQWQATNKLYKLRICRRFSRNIFFTDDLNLGRKVLFFLLSFRLRIKRRNKDGRTN